MKSCSVEGCRRKYSAKGLCDMHYRHKYYNLHGNAERRQKINFVSKPGRPRKSDCKDWQLQHLYNITLDQYDQMFQEQEGKCYICQRHQSELKSALSVDHDHKTGKVRKLLCQKCNGVLGHFESNVEYLKQVIDYIMTVV